MPSLFDQYDLLASSDLFDAQYYLATNPDVAALNTDPLLHYIETGAQEGRNPHAQFDTRYYLAQCLTRGERPANVLLHFILVGLAAGLKTRSEPESAPAPAPVRTPPLAAAPRPRGRGQKFSPKPNLDQQYQGCLDTLAADHRIEGWARDVGSNFRPLDVAIVINGEIAGAGRAQAFRRDLLDADIGHGCFAFRIYVHQLVSGKRVEASLIERNSGILIDGPKPFLVPTTRLSPRIELNEILAEVLDQETAQMLLRNLDVDFKNFVARRGVETMVDYAYCYALGRSADNEGMAAYCQHLTSGNLPASALITELLNSDEAKKYNKKLASALPEFLALDPTET